MSCRYTEIQYYSVLLYNVPVWLPLLLFSFLLVLASQWLELEGNIFNLNLLRKYWINMFVDELQNFEILIIDIALQVLNKGCNFFFFSLDAGGTEFVFT